MLHFYDYLIVLVVLFLSIFVGFTPQLIDFIKRLNFRKKNFNKNSATQLKNQVCDEETDLDEEIFSRDLETIAENELEIKTKTKNLAYNTSFEIKNRKNANLEATNKLSTEQPKANIFLTTISLVMGFQTTISLVGLPIEFYNYSFKSMQIVLCLSLSPFIIAYFFVPFLYKIKSKSLYEYLDDKFNGHTSVKYFTILISVLFQFVFASCVLFSTAVSLQQILPENLNILLWHICLFIGLLSAILAFFGLQSVVWANFVQYIIMVCCMVTIIIIGIINYGVAENNLLNSNTSSLTTYSSFNLGLKSMWNTTKLTNRDSFFVFKENFRDRYTFWNCLVGMMFNTISSYSLTQQSFMRIKQAKSIKSAKILVISIAPIGITNMSLILLFGYVIFSFYYKCGDPLSLKLIKNQNQLLSRFLIQFYDNYVGLLGLYIALLLSSAIGTLSSVLAALAVTLSEEIIKKLLYNLKKYNKTKRHQHKLNSTRDPSTLFDINELDDSADDEKNVLDKKRRKSVLQNEMINEMYLEEMLSLQINRLSVTKSKKKKLIKKYSPSFAKQIAERKLKFAVILVSSIILIIFSSLLELIPGSLSSIAFSLLNAIHGPVLFVYLSARFNKYSMKRYKYALHRSTTSKLRNFQFNHIDVILSCIISIVFVEFLFFAKLYTSENMKNFYTSDKMTLRMHPPNISDARQLEFCRYDKSIVEKMWTNANFSNYSVNENAQNESSNFFNYFYAISFNWYPFLSFCVCVFHVIFFNLIRFIYSLGCQFLGKRIIKSFIFK
jgi:Na+/proline symporter